MPEQLIDNYGRKIEYLRLSVTDRCNLRCSYCMPENGVTLLDKNQLLKFEEIIRIIKIFSGIGIKKVRLTGGEPLLRDNILDLIKEIDGIRAIKNISITTNGVLLGKYISGLYNAGVKKLNISLDSLNPDKFSKITRGGNIKKVILGIDKAIEMNFDSVKINVVLTNLIDELDIIDFIKLMIEKPVSIRFIEMMPVSDMENIECSRTISRSSKPELSVDKIISVMGMFGKYNMVKESNGDGPAVYYRIGKSKGKIGFILDDKLFCSNCNRIRLTPQGTIKLCLFSPLELNLRENMRKGYSDEEIRDSILDFIKEKPRDRGKNPYEKKRIDKVAGYMNKIGG